MRQNDDPVDVECIFKFMTENKQSIAVHLDPEDINEARPIFLPVSEITWENTGKREKVFFEVIRVTMPEWLALDRGMI